jgi:Zn-dependent protease
MLIMQYLGNPPILLAMIVSLIVGFSGHEYAHARVAYALGDPTAYYQGRLTLNPRAHVDPAGAFMFLMAGVGWAKPVPIDPYRLGRQGTLVVSLAGPGANLLMASIAALPLRFGFVAMAPPRWPQVAMFLLYFTWFNIVLAVFNVLPIPPLDGWKVLLGLVPADVAMRLSGFEQYGFMVLLALLVLGVGLHVSPLWMIMSPIVSLLTTFLLGPAAAPLT